LYDLSTRKTKNIIVVTEDTVPEINGNIIVWRTTNDLDKNLTSPVNSK